MVYAISKRIIWPVLRLFITKITGVNNLPDKPFILAANHSSYIDGVILIMLTAWHKNRQLCVFATNQKFTSYFWDKLFKHFGAIRVNGSLDKGIRAVNNGKSMGIFPEGGRTYDGTMQKITNTGLGVLALKTNAPVVPVHLTTWHWWNRYQEIPTFKRNIRIAIGKPKTFKGKPTKQNINKVTNYFTTEVKHLARTSHA